MPMLLSVIATIFPQYFGLPLPNIFYNLCQRMPRSTNDNSNRPTNGLQVTQDLKTYLDSVQSTILMLSQQLQSKQELARSVLFIVSIGGARKCIALLRLAPHSLLSP